MLSIGKGWIGCWLSDFSCKVFAMTLLFGRTFDIWKGMLYDIVVVLCNSSEIRKRMTGINDYMVLVIFSKIYWKIWKVKSKVFINYFLSGHLLVFKIYNASFTSSDISGIKDDRQRRLCF